MKLPFLIASAALAAAATLGAAYSELTSTAPAKVVPSASASNVHGAVAAATAVAPAASSTAAVAQSPETEHLEQRRILYETVDALLQASELERARRLLDEEQRRHGDDIAPEWRDLEQGYRLIADCLEHQSPKYRARGQAFLLVNEATSLNAKLRAACRVQ